MTVPTEVFLIQNWIHGQCGIKTTGTRLCTVVPIKKPWLYVEHITNYINKILHLQHN